ncbi:MAG: hypothetical protein LBJ74_02345, partial [Heliobacteriaceae bacterium]|nr:hypothetical protein [Heliobacteriaceae bacterium]
MTELNLSLGKTKESNINRLSGGIKREQITDEKLKSIYDTVDVDKNGILDADEMQKFQETIMQYAKDDNFSQKEAGKFLKKSNIKEISAQELFQFLTEISGKSEDIESSSVIEQNGEKVIQIKYKDGTLETVNPDKTSVITTTDENGSKTAQTKDATGNVIQEEVVDSDGNKTVIEYKSGKPATITKTNSGDSKEIIICDENGEPKSKNVKKGLASENYIIVDGKEQLQSKIENEGIPAKEKKTTYTYNDDESITEVITEAGQETVRTSKDGKVLSEKITGEDETVIQRTVSENGVVE